VVSFQGRTTRLSIRVPWHDTGWDGRVCANPRLNGACLKLKRIGQNRDDAAEEAVAGQSLKDLPQDKWPCCVAERVGFMSPFEYTRIANHPYKETSEDTHGHFAPTPLRHPGNRSHRGIAWKSDFGYRCSWHGRTSTASS
jgi:hypothetical protein